MQNARCLGRNPVAARTGPAGSRRQNLKSALSFFTLFSLVPYLVVLMGLWSQSGGLHGTLYTSSINVIYLDFNQSGAQLPRNGDYSGTIVIEDASGWLFCNGYVQRSGPYRIENAEVSYDASYDRSLHGLDNGAITLNGAKGDLRTGCHVAIFSLLVVPFGVVAWLVWQMVRRMGLRTYAAAWWAVFAAYIVTQLVVLFNGTNLLPQAFFLFAGFLFVFWLLRRRKKEFLEYVSRRLDAKYLGTLPYSYAFVGLILFACNFGLSMMVFQAYSYSSGADSMNFWCGVINMNVAVIPMAWGLGTVAELKAGTPVGYRW